MHCKTCGKIFSWNGHGRRPSYCSDTCRRKANRAKKRQEQAENTSGTSYSTSRESIRVTSSGKIDNVPLSIVSQVRDDITNRDFEKMMGHGFTDDLEFVKQIAKKAMTDDTTPASALPGLAKTLLDASKQLDSLDHDSSNSSLESLLKGETTDDVVFRPESQ
ncbi:hypothetical protein EJ419_07275 [Alloscardovia theropitheci]|uniref:FCS-type domain-containing protein n=1 Tax=Alloscardovia theropitheci TaxID=2496842 RepID=A0A4V6N6W0_9BIFI|nr:hypothetical protein [Alloscardovia theropitheci]TCD53759.1 hypothetical protein EJ419_07275 [Alloscardovia theropitheci]